MLYVYICMYKAEIQTINADGTLSLHTRSLRYGKLENGQFVSVPAGLIKRLPQVYTYTYLIYSVVCILILFINVYM